MGRVPGWARKLIVVLLAVGSFWADYKIPGDGNDGIAGSITVGLLVGILAAIFETQFTITDSAEESQRLLVGNQVAIQREVGGVSHLNRLRDRIAQDYGSTFLVNDVLEYEWSRFQDRLDSLANGSLKSRGFEALINAAAMNPQCDRLIAVTTLPAGVQSTKNWWTSNGGTHYRALNYEVVERGRSRGRAFPVERIWVYRKRDDLLASANRALLAEQVKRGVVVRTYLWRNDSIVPNFTIWNDDSAWEATLNWDEPPKMISGTFYAAPDDVRRLIAEWQRLKRESNDWTLPYAGHDGQTRVAWAAAPNSRSLPTATDMSRAIELTDSLPEGDRSDEDWLQPLLHAVDFDMSLQPLSNPSEFETTLPTKTWPESMDVDAPGYLAVRRFIPESTPWEEGQRVEFFPVTVRPSPDGVTFRLHGRPQLYSTLS